MKAIVISGRLGKDAELRRTQGGDPVLSFPVAVDDGFGESKRTMWFECSVWGSRASALEQHMKKGTSVSVSGALGTREYDGKTYLQVKVNDVTFMGNAPAKEERSAPRKQEPAGSYGAVEEMDDTIPF